MKVQEITKVLEHYEQELQQFDEDNPKRFELATYLDIKRQETSLLQQHTADSSKHKEIEQQWQRIADELEDRFHPIEFVNRRAEIQTITGMYYPLYQLINAPVGYGKTRLIATVKCLLQQQQWLCVHIELSRKKEYSLNEIMVLLSQQLGETRDTDTEQKTGNEWGYKIGRNILQNLHARNDIALKGVVLIIDEAEALAKVEDVAKQFLNHCLPAIKECLSSSHAPVQLRLIVAGRYLSHWCQWSSNIPLEPMNLASFSFEAVYQTVENFASAPCIPKMCDEYKRDFAAYLMYLTGGHPGCMVKILKKGDYGLPIPVIMSKEAHYYETIIEQVIEEAQQELAIPLRDIFERLSVFRRYNLKFLGYIINEQFIPYTDNQFVLEETLTNTHLVERKDDGFIQDDIVRRVFAIKVRRKEDIETYRILCQKARNIFKEFAKSNTYLIHLVVLEGLYQELQCRYYCSQQTEDDRQAIYHAFFKKDGILQEYLEILLKDANAPDVIANFRNILRRKSDWEFKFVINFFLRQDDHYTDEPYQQLLNKVEQFVSKHQRAL